MLILDYLTGKRKLWEAFWLLYAVSLTALTLLLPFILSLFAIKISPAIGVLLFAIFITYSMVAVWQCADNCKRKLWGWLARIWIVAYLVFRLYSEWHFSKTFISEQHIFSTLANLFSATFLVSLPILTFNKKAATARKNKFFIPCLLALSFIFSALGALEYMMPQLTSQQFSSEVFYQFGLESQYGAHGVEKNYETAIIFYKKAADKGHVFAKTNLATMYARGQGTAKNDVLAVQLYREASKAGDDLATYDLGLHYELGKGVEQNYNEAFKYYYMAAQKDVSCAQNDLGALYATGKGVRQDDAQARHWFQKAAIAAEKDDDLQLGAALTHQSYADAFIEYRLTLSKNPSALLGNSSPEAMRAAKKIAEYYENLCRK